MFEGSILFNDLTAIREKSGVGGYAEELLRELSPRLGSELLPLSKTYGGRLLSLASRFYKPSRSVSARAGSSRAAGAKDKPKALTQRAVARFAAYSAARHHPALYHEPDAIALSLSVPTVTTFHDLSVLRFPQWHPAHRVLKYEREIQRSLNQSQLFIAVSQSTAADLSQYLGVNANRIRVIPEAPRRGFRVLAYSQIREVRARYGFLDPYFLFVGTIEPRKNIERLLKAFAAMPASIQKSHRLILAGGWGWKSERVRALLSESPWRERVVATGYLPDFDLVALLNGATALAYPSLHEGFGLPPLEAMVCEVPVITTGEGALKETVGDAAVRVDPEDVEGLSTALAKFAQEPQLRRSFIERGRQRVAHYSWQKTADLTLRVYSEVLGRSIPCSK